MHEIVETAPAKINLTLNVLGRRGDGLHELDSIVVFADIGDLLRYRPGRAAAGSGTASLEVTGHFAADIVGENLVERAVRMVEASCRCRLDGYFLLEKHVPVAAGIGGGSADAAAALRILRRVLAEGQWDIDWHGLAGKLGADVPVCLMCQPARITGAGECLLPVRLPGLDIVLVNAGLPVPADKTRQVFQALAAGPSEGGAPRAAGTDYDRSELVELMRTAGNDLERPALRVLPGIEGVKAAVQSTAACEIAVLSGAGPTIVGVYPSTQSAQAAASQLQQWHPSWWVRAGRTYPS